MKNKNLIQRLKINLGTECKKFLKSTEAIMIATLIVGGAGAYLLVPKSNGELSQIQEDKKILSTYVFIDRDVDGIYDTGFKRERWSSGRVQNEHLPWYLVGEVVARDKEALKQYMEKTPLLGIKRNLVFVEGEFEDYN